MEYKIKNLKVKRSFYNICQKGLILTGTGFLGAGIALTITRQPNAECLLTGFMLLSAGVDLSSNAINAEQELKQYEVPILGRVKYHFHNQLEDNTPILGRRKFHPHRECIECEMFDKCDKITGEFDEMDNCEILKERKQLTKHK